MWCLISLYDNEDDVDEKSPDLIPNGWIINKLNCWYPLDFKISTIKKYAKSKEIPDYNKWKKCRIDIVEENIDNYEYGLKLMYKLNKNTNLHSEVEERGRGQRLKVKAKRSLEQYYSSHSDEDDILFKDMPTPYPAFPKKQKNQSQLFNETNNCFDNISPPRNEFDTLCLTNKSSVQSSSSTPFSTPIPDEPSKTLQKCKLAKKVVHSCTFDFKDKSLLEAIGHQLCKLSADINRVKSNIKYVKQDVSSFIEDQPVPNRQTNTNSEEHYLSCFPLKSESELLAIESTLQNEDLSYTNKLVSTLVFASEGKNISKVTYSILKIMFSDELLKYYSWKGQKNKKPFSEFKICKVIIGAVRQKFPDQKDCRNDIINSIMSWLAQAPTRIANKEKQKKRSHHDEDNNIADDNIISF
uniref:DUF4806 domain-containing protein n=1 Tax=Schizaphis graminum TaxID=13262 RepID=A0A2S2NLM2_SCHGA